MFVQLLSEGSTPTAKCTKSQLDAWIKGAAMPFSAFRDVDTASFAITKAYGERMTAYVLDRATRKILFKGSDATALSKLQAL